MLKVIRAAICYSTCANNTVLEVASRAYGRSSGHRIDIGAIAAARLAADAIATLPKS
jgi:hypothetical protein